jgi:S1-C subfamily serine protease
MNEKQTQYAKKSICKVTGVNRSFNHTEPYIYGEEYESGGTGFFVDPKLFGVNFPFSSTKRYILTNFHVVKDFPSQQCTLEWPKRASSYLTATVLFVVPQLDVAILEVDPCGNHHQWWNKDVQMFLEEVPNLNLDTTTMIKGNSQKCKAIGFPNLQDDYQLGDGVISGRGLGMIQLDISLNGGNSGGPLFLKNKVIGICTATVADSERLGLAVPMQVVHAFFSKWTTYDNQCLRTPNWGLVCKTLTPDYLDYKKIDRAYQGTLVKQVLRDQAGDLAGIKKNDIIMGLNSGEKRFNVDMHGKITVPWTDKQVPINDMEFILSLDPDNVEFVVYRNGRVKNIHITPAFIDFKVRIRYPYYEPLDYECFGGVVFMNLTMNHLGACDSEDEEPTEDCTSLIHEVHEGVALKDMLIVSHIAAQSHVDALNGLSPFDRVVKVNRKTVNNVKQLGKVLDSIVEDQLKFIEIETTDDKHYFNVSNLVIQEQKDASRPHYPHEKLRLNKKRRRLY